ncbi:MAG TPA: DNA internalization-related competence protein ComEC/Rec2 [bacterium]|nr:DNA internalization-related competence protein ComEC/Rec2 [bacterium]
MHRPVVVLACAFAVGIALSRTLPLSLEEWLVIAVLVLAAAGGLLSLGRDAVLPLTAAAMCAGALVFLYDARPPPHDPFLELDGRRVILTGVVAQPPLRRGDRLRVVIAAEAIGTGEGVRSVRGRVIVSLRPAGETVRYGDLVRVTGRLVRPPDPGNPGEFSYRDHLAAQGIRAALTLRRGDAVRVLARERGHPVLAGIYAIRDRVARVFTAALPGPRGALLLSLLLGDDGALGSGTTNVFARAGLLHVLVVSGTQVALVMGMVVWLARLLRAPPLPAAIASALAVVGFALMTGWAPSVARAAIMGVIGASALAGGRVYDVTAALAVAALGLLASSPFLLLDVGFQLSFTATWALVYVAPALRPHLRRLPGPAASLVAVSVSAQVAVMPVLAYHFQQVSVASFAANLIVVPLVGLLVPAGFAAAALALMLPPAAAVVLAPLAPLLDLIHLLARFFSGLPGAAIPVFPPSLPLIAVFYLILSGAVEVLRGRFRFRRSAAAAGALAVLALLIWGRVLAGGPALLAVAVLDVGQGDAILLRSPSGQTVLIDGGGEVEGGRATGYDVGARRVVPALRHLGVRRLDLVILSHPHEDHAGGLVAVLQNFRVGLVLDSGLAHAGPSYARLRELAAARGVPVRPARRGMRIDLGDGVTAAVLLPEEPLITGSGSDPNLNSVVVRITYHRVGALFTGDMEALNESQLLALGDDLRSTILKVAHHGGSTGTTEAFVDAVRPAVAVISVGAVNPFGHPHPRTLDVLEEWGAAVYRTDRDGAVLIHTDGRRVAVRTVRR